jgi:hypothetical protein
MESADQFFRNVIDGYLEENKNVFAAETAEEAGFWGEAIDLFAGLGTRESRLHAARLAAENGQPALAVNIFLQDEALMDAMRVAEENGMVEFVLQYCEASDNPVLIHFGADTAKRAGDPDRGLAILKKHGDLHQAALFAREAGLLERADEIVEELRARKHRPDPGALEGF